MQRTGLGSAIVFGALANGDIDVYVDYSGTIWANVMGRTDVPRASRCSREIRAWLATDTASLCSGSWASRTPMGLRCGAIEPSGSGSRRSPISRRIRPS